MVRTMKNEMENEREHEMDWNYVRVMGVCSYVCMTLGLE